MGDSTSGYEILEHELGKYVREKVAPYYVQGDLEGAVPQWMIDDLIRLGYWGMAIPEKYGGAGADSVAQSIAARAIAYGWPSLHFAVTIGSWMSSFPIIHYGTEDQKQRILPRVASGEISGCYALTEPDAGSDAANLAVRAEWNEDRGVWVLNGEKHFITNSPLASFAVIFARVPGMRTSGRRYGGITAFILEANGPGLQYPGVTVRKLPKFGMAASPFASIVLQDVELPPSALLGKVDKGFAIAMHTLDDGRRNIAALAHGITERAFDEAQAYAEARLTFDTPLASNQKVSFDLSDVRASLVMVWQEILRVSRMEDRGEDYKLPASDIKKKAVERGMEAAELCYEMYGGLGQLTETIPMHLIHDIRVAEIGEGAPNILSMIGTRAPKNYARLSRVASLHDL